MATTELSDAVPPTTLRGGAATRRRGAKLEAALLQAAWDELTAVGYAALTMENVAARAKLSDNLSLKFIEEFVVSTGIVAPAMPLVLPRKTVVIVSIGRMGS